MIAVKHILVPTDFSEPAERALSTALDLARIFGARVTLLHVWQIPVTGYPEGAFFPVDQMEKAAQAALDGVHARAVKEWPDVDAVLRLGVDYTQILELVNERGIDFVVMGTHGRRGLPRLLLGSVAEKVVRLSPVPVLTVRGSETGTDKAEVEKPRPENAQAEKAARQ
jgi:nucleotide-binding universal stress UspA family protein